MKTSVTLSIDLHDLITGGTALVGGNNEKLTIARTSGSFSGTHCISPQEVITSRAINMEVSDDNDNTRQDLVLIQSLDLEVYSGRRAARTYKVPVQYLRDFAPDGWLTYESLLLIIEQCYGGFSGRITTNLIAA